MINQNKVIRVTVFFWIMKILATTLGETLGDLLSMTFNLGYLVSLGITATFFLVVLFIQLKTKQLYPYLYWVVIVSTTTVGTEISDFMDRTLGLGYLYGSLILLTLLLSTLIIWYKNDKKLTVYPIYLLKIEVLYWVAVLFSNSLGTAFGDFLSDNIGLSYLTSALATAGVIVIVFLVHQFAKVNQVLLFWIAFIFTRPFGATFGDLLTKPLAKGGLDLGTLPATLVTATILSLFILYTHKKQLSE
ncbi:MAG: hypothetical protein R2800_03410 [Flavipsychrobacter sp.]